MQQGAGVLEPVARSFRSKGSPRLVRGPVVCGGQVQGEDIEVTVVRERLCAYCVGALTDSAHEAIRPMAFLRNEARFRRYFVPGKEEAPIFAERDSDALFL